MEGVGCFLTGLCGPGVGVTSYSENIGAIGLTKVTHPHYIFFYYIWRHVKKRVKNSFYCGILVFSSFLTDDVKKNAISSGGLSKKQKWLSNRIDPLFLTAKFFPFLRVQKIQFFLPRLDLAVLYSVVPF